MKIDFRSITTGACIVLVAANLAACGKDPYAGKPMQSQENVAVEAAAPAPGPQFDVAKESPEQVLAMKPVQTCALENVAALVDNLPRPGAAPNSWSVGKGQAYRLIGFASNRDAGAVPATFRLVLVGAKVYALAAATGAARPDVAAYFKTPAFAKAGYQADAAFDRVDAGEYRVFALQGAGAETLACPTYQRVTVK